MLMSKLSWLLVGQSDQYQDYYWWFAQFPCINIPLLSRECVTHSEKLSGLYKSKHYEKTTLKWIWESDWLKKHNIVMLETWLLSRQPVLDDFKINNFDSDKKVDTLVIWSSDYNWQLFAEWYRFTGDHNDFIGNHNYIHVFSYCTLLYFCSQCHEWLLSSPVFLPLCLDLVVFVPVLCRLWCSHLFPHNAHSYLSRVGTMPAHFSILVFMFSYISKPI